MKRWPSHWTRTKWLQLLRHMAGRNTFTVCVHRAARQRYWSVKTIWLNKRLQTQYVYGIITQRGVFARHVNSLRPSGAYMRRWTAWSAPSQYLNQCWKLSIRTLGKNFSAKFVHLNSRNSYENVVYKTVAILSQPQCVKVSDGTIRRCITNIKFLAEKSNKLVLHLPSNDPVSQWFLP